jgi:hypothetical protein
VGHGTSSGVYIDGFILIFGSRFGENWRSRIFTCFSCQYFENFLYFEELDCPAVSALRRAITDVKQRWSVIGWITKIYYLELLRALEGTLSRWSRLHLQSLAPTNLHWDRVVD